MKAWWLALVLCMIATSASAVEPLIAEPSPVAAPNADASSEEPPAAPPAAPVATMTPAEPIISPPPAQPATPEDAVRAALNGTSWDVQVAPLSGSEGKPSKDTLSFADGQVSSASLVKAGYPSTNYSLTIREDGTASWETMQSQEGKGIVFWRGELGGPKMRGVMSKRPAEGPTEDFGFFGEEATGTSIEIPLPGSAGAPASALVKPAASAAPAAVTRAAPAAMPSAPAAPQPKKDKKKGWF